MEKQKKKHNGIISFWKFMFCLMIIIHHGKILSINKVFKFFNHGDIGVEFFFIVSGFFLGKKALSIKEDTKELGKETFKYIINKIKIFLPYSIVAGIILLIIINLYDNIPISKNILTIFDILFLQMSGIKTNVINGPIWYISSMLICMAIIYPLLRKYKYKFVYIFIPIIIIFIFGYSNHTYNNLKGIHEWIFFTFRGNFRAFADLSLGVLIYFIVEKEKNIEYTKNGQIVITLLEIMGFIITFLIANFIKDAGKYDLIVVIFLSISLVLALSEKTLEHKLLCNKFSYYLEKLSLAIYFLHYPIIKIMIYTKIYTKYTYTVNIVILIISTIISSIIITKIIDKLKEKNYYLDKIKYTIIKKD